MSDVLLIGSGIPAYVAALELAEVGVKVWVAKPEVKLPRVPVRDPGGEVAGLLGELAQPITPGATAAPGVLGVSREPVIPQLRAVDGTWKPQSASVWGIPTMPLAKECLALLGTRGAFRAYLDRIKPVLTIGKEENLGELVESRLGASVRELMVDPVVYERFGVHAHEAEVSVVEPGLNEALTRAGSLSGGAGLQVEAHVARETVIEPSFGWHALGEMLSTRLGLYGAEEFLPGIAVIEAVNHVGADGVSVGVGWAVTDDEGVRHRFDAIVADIDDADLINPGPGIGAGPGPGQEEPLPFSERLAALRPPAARLYAEIGIESSAVKAAGFSAGEYLQLLTAENGAVWAARLGVATDGSASVHLAGPAALDGARLHAPINEALESFNVAGFGLDVTQRSAEAPHVSAAARDAQRDARQAWSSACPELLFVGESLHGGELGSAIGEARELAIYLRRKLTGISE